MDNVNKICKDCIKFARFKKDCFVYWDKKKHCTMRAANDDEMARQASVLGK